MPPRQSFVPTAKAGPVGPGAGPLMTEFLLPNVLSTDPRKGMQRAVQIGVEVAYIRLAEMTISAKIADPLMGVGWHLEDPKGETIDAKYADPKAVEAFCLIDKPMANWSAPPTWAKSAAGYSAVRSRDAIWEVTSRHMGLAGQGAWYLDELNGFGIPQSIAYIRPDRLEPQQAGGILQGWIMDRRPGFAGIPLEADEIELVQLQTPDDGIWAPGLVESAYAKARLNGAIDTHFAQVLAGGGRLSGILAPKNGAIDDDAVYNQLVRDWRNITSAVGCRSCGRRSTSPRRSFRRMS